VEQHAADHGGDAGAEGKATAKDDG
jgi:hypothetical protein